MRPREAEQIPEADSMPGGVQYTIKLDGFRALAFVLEDDQVVLQSRSGRNLTTEFPDVAAHLSGQLPPGTVLDGELCAYAGSRLAFTELLRSHAARQRAGVPVYFIAFDALAVPGRDLRNFPLRTRWEALSEALEGSTPPLQKVMATLDRETASTWFRDLLPLGVEGIVAKDLNSPYRAGDTWAWRKVRHSETHDVLVIGVFGSEQRPESLLVKFADGRVATTTPRLTSVQARHVSEAMRGRLDKRLDHPEYGPVTMVNEPLAAEVRETSGRHEVARFVRLRSND